MRHFWRVSRRVSYHVLVRDHVISFGSRRGGRGRVWLCRWEGAGSSTILGGLTRSGRGDPVRYVLIMMLIHQGIGIHVPLHATGIFTTFQPRFEIRNDKILPLPAVILPLCSQNSFTYPSGCAHFSSFNLSTYSAPTLF